MATILKGPQRGHSGREVFERFIFLHKRQHEFFLVVFYHSFSDRSILQTMQAA